MIIVLFEMVLIHSLARRDPLKVAGVGSFLFGAGLALLPFGSGFALRGFHGGGVDGGGDAGLPAR